MKMLVSLLMLLVLHGSAQASEKPTLIVSTVQIEGLERTREYIVTNEFEFQVGKPTTLEAVEETAQVLRNMGIFARVEYDLDPREDGTFHLRIELLERWTTLPVFKAARGGGVTQLIFAVFDINVFGHFLELGAEYERLGSTNSGVLWFRNPRLFDRRLALGAEVRSSNRVLTLYAADGSVEGGYLLGRNQVWLSLEQEWLWWFKAGLHLQFIDGIFTGTHFGGSSEVARGARIALTPTTPAARNQCVYWTFEFRQLQNRGCHVDAAL